MAFKPRKCPMCHSSEGVDDKLFCSTCNNQLEYADALGSLNIKSSTNRCRRCHTENNAGSVYCESCGAQLTRECSFCKGTHSVDARVCGRYGEPLEAHAAQSPKITTIIGESFNLVLNRHRKAILVPLAIMAMIIGYYAYTKIGAHTIVLIPDGQKPRIDVVFVIDSTGSMADEIQVVQVKLKEMAAKIKSGQPVPDVRMGLVTFRDRGDDYVVKKFDFTEDINRFQKYVNTLVADGGGDTKESVSEALHTAINDMGWDNSQNAKKLLFLIGDAGPHMDYNNGLDYNKEAADARNKGIKIFTLGCSGIEEDGEPEFREIAEATGGTFDFLTYREQYVDDTGATFYRLKAGDSYYTYDSKDGDGWREGAKAAEKKGAARKVDAPLAAPGGSGGEYVFGDLKARQQDCENNIDSTVTKTVQQVLENEGVKY